MTQARGRHCVCLCFLETGEVAMDLRWTLAHVGSQSRETGAHSQVREPFQHVHACVRDATTWTRPAIDLPTVRGDSIGQLARNAGIDVAGLEATIARFNEFARVGKDEDFHRGESASDKRSGDTANIPNPSLRALVDGPFYAIKLYAGDFSALSGLMVDAGQQVLDRSGVPVAGLYAAGNDACSMMGGSNISPGSILGPALVGGYAAVQHMASSTGQSTAMDRGDCALG